MKRVVVPPKLVKFVEAEFPPSELAAEKSATVTLQIAIKDSGEVAAVDVAGSAGPAFDAAAVAAVKQFVFEPATVNGKPTPVRITYRYEFTWTPTLIKKTTADFVGTVRERGTKKPAVGVKVALDTGAFAVTDAAGHFAFADLAPGTHAVTLSGERLTSVATSEILEAGKQLDATYEIDRKQEKVAGEEEDDLEIVVTAPRLDKQVVATEVAAEQGRKVPGTQGDVLKVVEDLPGVARSAVGSGALVVWGAAPQDTRVYIDDVRVPRLYHDGGYRSVMQSDMVRSVELIPGGYGPGWGRGLGGLVNVQLRPLDERGFHGSVSADTIDAAVSVRDEITDRLHVAVGGRKSYLDSVVGAFTNQNLGEIVPIPQYYDGQARLSYDLGDHEAIELGGLLSSDTTKTSVISPDPALTTSQTTGLTFGRVYAHYEKHTPEGATIVVVPWWGQDLSTLNSLFGSIPTMLRDESNVFELPRRAGAARSPSTSRPAWASTPSSSTRASSASARSARRRERGTCTSSARPRPASATPTPGRRPSPASPPTPTPTSPPSATASTSLPASASSRTSSPRRAWCRRSATSPRWGTRQREHRGRAARSPVRLRRHARASRLKAAFGIYHQPPSGEDLSAVFGTPKLGLSQADHYVLGGVFKLTHTLDVEVTGFLSESDRTLVVRSAAPSPPTSPTRSSRRGSAARTARSSSSASSRSAPFSAGSATRSSGASGRITPTPTGASSITTRRTSSPRSARTISGSGFEASARRFRYATGFPRTPVTGAYFDSLSSAYQPQFGGQNSIRIPAFYALDVRLSKHFKLGKSEGEAYLDVQNVTNHANPEEIVYNPYVPAARLHHRPPRSSRSLARGGRGEAGRSPSSSSPGRGRVRAEPRPAHVRPLVAARARGQRRIRPRHSRATT